MPLIRASQSVAKLLLEWSGTVVDGISKTERILERARPYLAGASTDVCSNLLFGCADVMDSAALKKGSNDWGTPGIWTAATALLPDIMIGLPNQRDQLVERLFREGSSIGWLTHVFRGEEFAHGRVGKKVSKENQVLTGEEVVDVERIMIARYRAMGVGKILKLSRPLSAMFAWS